MPVSQASILFYNLFCRDSGVMWCVAPGPEVRIWNCWPSGSLMVIWNGIWLFMEVMTN